MRDAANVPPFYILSDPALISARARALGIDFKIREATPDTADRVFADALPVVPLAAGFTDWLGRPDRANAAGILESIDRAVADTFAGAASAIVTCPIAKKPLYEAGFKFPGHTEYLAHLAAERTGKPATPVMMLAGPDLRTVPVTIHIALADVPAALTIDGIVTTAHIVAVDLAGPLWHRPAAPGDCRPQSACRRRRRYGAGGQGNRAAGGGNIAGGRY